MLRLRTAGVAHGFDDIRIGLVKRVDASASKIALFGTRASFDASAFGDADVWLSIHDAARSPSTVADAPSICAVPALDHLEDGDIVAAHPTGRIDTVFRAGSVNNSLFVTEQCNSLCLMCSQPPRRVDDIPALLATNVRAVRLMPTGLATLGITGGEPTLLGENLAQLLAIVRTELPATQIEVLSNGRLLSDADLASRIAGASDALVLFSIPLHSDYPPHHDFIVQSRGAFDETVQGLYNLAALGVRREIRVVLHQQTYRRLPALARFIQKNLPFVEHVALMGLEVTGFARANERLLWVEPGDYSRELGEAVGHLVDFGLSVSIYNLPLCLLPEHLRPYSRVSISDWKREYRPECTGCQARHRCGGVFGTSTRQSSRLAPL